MKDDRGEIDLTFLAEQHAKEIWALKEQISKQSEELTVLRGTKDVVVRLTNELVRMKKRAQEAEGELSILKGLETNRVKEAQDRSGQLQDELDRVKKENNKLYNEIAQLKQDEKS